MFYMTLQRTSTTPMRGLPACKRISTTSWSPASAWQEPCTPQLQHLLHQPRAKNLLLLAAPDSQLVPMGPPLLRQLPLTGRHATLHAPLSHWTHAFKHFTSAARPFFATATHLEDLMSLLHAAGILINPNSHTGTTVPSASSTAPAATVAPSF